jgi:hypothetical protein
MSESMRQYAPYPIDLAELVETVRYRQGWRFSLDDVERDHAHSHGAAAGGLTLRILIDCVNSYGPKRNCGHCGQQVRDYSVYHYFVVPAATYNRQAWRRWLFD